MASTSSSSAPSVQQSLELDNIELAPSLTSLQQATVAAIAPKQTTETEAANRRTLDNLNFDNTALRSLPLDPISENYVRKKNPNTCFSRVSPTPVANPRLVAYSPEALWLLDLDLSEVENNPQFAEYFGGNKVLKGSEPAAHCYCGHQFGNFAGQLGDGRAMYLGEIVNTRGERWEIQLKGAGKTPYSRDADGRAVLRSSIREFLCSEAMFHLGIPTTRAGTVVVSDTLVVRDIFYNGNPIRERATLVLRIAPTFLRFGSFQIASGPDPTTGREGPSPGRTDIIATLMDYTVQQHYPHIWNDASMDKQDKYAAFFEEVVLRTARLVAEWQCVGFAHGVLNTDNLSIVGVTIDYGPFGFMDWYDPDFICNGSDNGGRYAFKNQPDVCRWNLERLADALSPMLPLTVSRDIIKKYQPEFDRYYYEKMHKKLGLFKDFGEEDQKLIQSLLDVMQQTGADFTNTFRCLSKVSLLKLNSRLEEESEAAKSDSAVHCILRNVCDITTMQLKHSPSIPKGQLQMLLSMAEKNPYLVYMMGYDPQFLADEVAKLERANELSAVDQVQKAEKDHRLWHAWISQYMQRLEKEIDDSVPATSTSSTAMSLEERQAERERVMNATNPKYILRNYMAQNAIDKAEKENDFSEVNRLLRLLRNPFGLKPEAEDIRNASPPYDSTPPQWASKICVT